MLREDAVREVLARLARGEHVKAIALLMGATSARAELTETLLRIGGTSVVLWCTRPLQNHLQLAERPHTHRRKR